MNFEMEPMQCTVDDKTYRIIDTWFGREVAGKLLYDQSEVTEHVHIRVSVMGP